MTTHLRRDLRATVIVAGLLSGTAFVSGTALVSGTAFAAEHGDTNGCRDGGTGRAPIGAMENGLGGYNGNSADDCSYGSDDYTTRTGFRGDSKSNGYNGYLGSDEDELDKNHYLFGVPGS